MGCLSGFDPDETRRNPRSPQKEKLNQNNNENFKGNIKEKDFIFCGYSRNNVHESKYMCMTFLPAFPEFNANDACMVACPWAYRLYLLPKSAVWKRLLVVDCTEFSSAKTTAFSCYSTKPVTSQFLPLPQLPGTLGYAMYTIVNS